VIVDSNIFMNVPEHQTYMLKQFIAKHPYKKHSVNGIQYEYIATGNGKRTIVFLHGAMFNPYMWFYPISQLENDFNILAPKIPEIGMGANESVNYIKNILDAENISNAIILGYSYGGGIAQYFAEIYPEYIEILVLSNTGILRRSDSIERTKKMIKIIGFLPSFTINIIKSIRTKSGKESDWFNFRKAFFNLTFKSITKKDFIEHFKKNLEFFNEIDYLPIGEVSWKGKTILLGTKSDKDTFSYFSNLKKIYENNINYVFEESGGHHMLFLYPEKYTQILRDFL